MKTGQGLGDLTKIRVLRYSRIVDDRELSEKHLSCLYVQKFRRQLELMERLGYTPITFDDYRLFLKGELNLPRKPIVLTFDGVYLDNYRVMFPTLQKAGGRAVLFAHGDRHIKENTWETEAGIPRAQMMDQEHLLELHAAGFEIGSHTMTHQNLVRQSPEKASEEIIRSRILLEILLNAPVLSFAYPFGVLDGRIKRIVAEAGYSLACATHSGPSRFGTDAFEIRRSSIRSDATPFSFSLKLLAF